VSQISPESRNAAPEAERLRLSLQGASDILLIRLRSLGDAILTLPLVEALHRWRPDLRQSVLIEAPFAPVFLHHPAIHETLVLRKNKDISEGWTRLRALAELRKRRYAAALNLHGGTTSMVYTIASGARLRIGQKSHRYSWLYSARIPSSTSLWGRESLHTVEHQLSLLRWLNLPMESADSMLYVGKEAKSRIHDLLANSEISEFLLIQPTATLQTKLWPAAKFAGLGDWLSARHKIPVIFTAAAHEKHILTEIEQNAQNRHIYWSNLPLIDLFALIERCRLFIGCDSGPAHAAAAMKKPVVVVWGSSNLRAWHPWETDYETVGSRLPCMPCPGYTCAAFGEPKCILEIPVTRVAEACERMLAKTSLDQR
jgi:heptosyltransferase III